jgi:AAA family ATP:ADP antiporter
MLRSVREAMAIVSGVQNIPWLFTGTFVVMMMAAPVFGWIASRYARKKFIPWVYYFFIVNILLFYAAFLFAQHNEISQVWISRAFFVWLSVFNLFVVSVFWSFMADVYDKDQSRRLFGVISAGGSAGALLGPLATSALVVPIGFQNLLPLSALLLSVGVFCVYRLRGWVRQSDLDDAESVESGKAIGGSALAGMKLVVTSPFYAAIATALLCASFLGVATYMYMAQLVSVTFDTTDEQTRVFALLDALTNAIALIGQLIIVKHAVRWLGVGSTLAILPIVSIAAFLLLAMNPVFIVIAALQVVRRSITFGLTKPTNDMLYTVVSPEAKYKAKNFIETAVYRGSDLVSTWTIRAMSGIGVTGVALVCIPIAAIWTVLAFYIGREYKKRYEAKSKQVHA